MSATKNRGVSAINFTVGTKLSGSQKTFDPETNPTSESRLII
jgi:hypothetical protein